MKPQKLILLVVTLLSIAGIYWVNSGMADFKTASDMANEEPSVNYTLPPGFIFSIWGFIYLGFLVYAFAGLSKKAAADLQMNKTAVPFAISILLNLVWTLVVGFDQWILAYFVQWTMLAISLYIMFQWELENKPLSNFQQFLSIPFALYAGWLTVAMIPFTSDLLNRSDWDYQPFSQITWAVIIYFVAFIIVIAAYRKLKQPFYLLPLAWAFFGFFMKFDGVLKIVAAALAGILVILFFFGVRKFYSSKP
jgi:translocator protein